VEYLIFILAVFTLFNTMIALYRSAWIAFFSVSVFLTSPLLVYYGLSFIADVPALSIGILCFCYTLKFYRTKKIKQFYLALILGTLAVLMKASGLIGLSLLLFCSLVDIFNLNRFVGLEKLFEKKVWPALCISVSVISIVIWYRFALFYNEYNSNNIFLLTVLPIWDMNEDQLIYNLKMLFNNLFPLFLNKPMFFLFVTLVIFVSARFKMLDNFLRYAFLLSGLFFVFYVLFFFQVFSVHDYYLTCLMIFPAITFVCFAHIVSQLNFIASNGAFIRIFVVCVVIFNSFHAAAIYRLRMIEDDKMVYWFPFVSEDEKNLAKYLFWDYGNAIKKIEDIRPELRKHGIKREDKVLSIPDMSFDISLYFMDQKGYTIARDHLINDTTVADRFFTRGIKYVIMSDTTLKHQIAFRRVIDKLEPFFTFNRAQVYKVKSEF
jgi:hypothetical protein